MPSIFSPRVNNAASLIAAFLAGQAVMFGMVALLRPTPAGAQTQPATDPGVINAKTIVLHSDPGGAGMELSAVGASGGPAVSFFDSAGLSRMQFNVDAKGKPTIILRDKKGAVALGVGLDNDTPVIAVRTADGKMANIPLPGEAPTDKP